MKTYRNVSHPLMDNPLDQCICLQIHTTRCFIQHQYLAPPQQRPDQRHYRQRFS